MKRFSKYTVGSEGYGPTRLQKLHVMPTTIFSDAQQRSVMRAANQWPVRESTRRRSSAIVRENAFAY
jgi:hypothetical protein